MWRQQFKKELMGHRGEILLLAGALVVWTLFLLSRSGLWSSELIVALYWAPSGFLPLWALWTSVQLYRQEWRENTSYLMLSLPVRAWKITSVKLAVLAAGIVGFSLLLLAGAWLVAARSGFLAELAETDLFAVVPREWVVKMLLLLYALMVAGFVVMGLVAQFAYVFSRLFSRFRGLMMVWTWILLFWLMGRVGDIGGRLLAWMPDFHLRSLDATGGVLEFHLLTIESGPFWALVLFTAGLYALLNIVLERAIEV